MERKYKRFNPNKLAMFCSNIVCCTFKRAIKGKYTNTTIKSKILVSYDLNSKKCPDCNGELFSSKYTKMSPKKEWVKEIK